MKRILCYGDSNTWGSVPAFCPGERWGPDVRWTGVCQKELGSEFLILEDGVSGRTSIWDDPQCPWRNGEKALGYSLLAQRPLDLLVLSLGTNDLKFTDAAGAAAGLAQLLQKLCRAEEEYGGAVGRIFNGVPKILVLGAIALHPEIRTLQPNSVFSQKYEDSCRLSEEQRKAAEAAGVFYLSMAQRAKASPVDGLHMDAQAHALFGKAVADAIKSIFS